MTYPPLVGSRKLSVEDAERLFSSSLLRKRITSMKHNTYVPLGGGDRPVTNVDYLSWKDVGIIIAS